ncbi:hypothetical protein HDU67_004323 [Dinochytrium kinnereticum]|nr:hypothetical protein HDU67_004323 [Dinochytrium kinnereticum]
MSQGVKAEDVPSEASPSASDPGFFPAIPENPYGSFKFIDEGREPLTPCVFASGRVLLFIGEYAQVTWNATGIPKDATYMFFGLKALASDRPPYPILDPISISPGINQTFVEAKSGSMVFKVPDVPTDLSYAFTGGFIYANTTATPSDSSSSTTNTDTFPASPISTIDAVRQVSVTKDTISICERMDIITGVDIPLNIVLPATLVPLGLSILCIMAALLRKRRKAKRDQKGKYWSDGPRCPENLTFWRRYGFWWFMDSDAWAYILSGEGRKGEHEDVDIDDEDEEDSKEGKDVDEGSAGDLEAGPKKDDGAGSWEETRSSLHEGKREHLPHKDKARSLSSSTSVGSLSGRPGLDPRNAPKLPVHSVLSSTVSKPTATANKLQGKKKKKNSAVKKSPAKTAISSFTSTAANPLDDKEAIEAARAAHQNGGSATTTEIRDAEGNVVGTLVIAGGALPERFRGGSSSWTPPPPPPNGRYFVAVAHKADSYHPDEIDVNRGEVFVAERFFEDGWVLGRRENPAAIYNLTKARGGAAAAALLKTLPGAAPQPPSNPSTPIMRPSSGAGITLPPTPIGTPSPSPALLPTASVTPVPNLPSLTSQSSTAGSKITTSRPISGIEIQRAPSSVATFSSVVNAGTVGSTASSSSITLNSSESTSSSPSSSSGSDSSTIMGVPLTLDLSKEGVDDSVVVSPKPLKATSRIVPVSVFEAASEAGKLTSEPAATPMRTKSTTSESTTAPTIKRARTKSSGSELSSLMTLPARTKSSTSEITPGRTKSSASTTAVEEKKTSPKPAPATLLGMITGTPAAATQGWGGFMKWGGGTGTVPEEEVDWDQIPMGGSTGRGMVPLQNLVPLTDEHVLFVAKKPVAA